MIQKYYTTIFKTLLSNDISLVVDHAVAALREVIKTLKLDMTQIYTGLVAIAHLSEDEVALRVKTLSQTSGIFGAQLCKAFTVPLLSALSENRSIIVRTALAESLPHLASSTPLPKFEFIIERLLADTEVNLEMIKVSPSLLRFVRRTIKELLANFLIAALDSFSKPLRHKAKLVLGPFISEFGPIVPQKIIDSWLSLATGRPWQARTCAEHFPGVLLNIGLEFWPSCSSTFLSLSKHKDKQVRLSVAKVLKDVAHLIGKDQAGRDLSLIFVNYMKDPGLIGDTICNCANFLSGLPSSLRVVVASQYFAHMYLLTDWRLLHAIAQQLDAVSNLLAPAEAMTLLLPAALHLLSSNVAKVREAAAPSLASMLILYNDIPLQGRVVEAFDRLITSRQWQNRALAAIACSRLIESKEAFERHAFVSFAELCKDPVANIRLRAAEVVYKALQLNYSDSYWESLKVALSADCVPEVRRKVQGTDPWLKIVKREPSEVDYEVSWEFSTASPALINFL